MFSYLKNLLFKKVKCELLLAILKITNFISLFLLFSLGFIYCILLLFCLNGIYRRNRNSLLNPISYKPAWNNKFRRVYFFLATFFVFLSMISLDDFLWGVTIYWFGLFKKNCILNFIVNFTNFIEITLSIRR